MSRDHRGNFPEHGQGQGDHRSCRDQIGEASRRVDELGVAAKEIGKVTEAITAISSQTKITGGFERHHRNRPREGDQVCCCCQ